MVHSQEKKKRKSPGGSSGEQRTATKTQRLFIFALTFKAPAFLSNLLFFTKVELHFTPKRLRHIALKDFSDFNTKSILSSAEVGEETAERGPIVYFVTVTLKMVERGVSKGI